MAEESVSQPVAVARPFDQAGQVGDDELVVVVDLDHAEIGLEGGERVVGDLRLRPGDHRDERALACGGEPDEGHVGQELELEAKPLVFTRLTLLGERRCPPSIRQEPGVALPPLAAGCAEPAVAVARQVDEDLTGLVVEDHGADRDPHDLVRAALAVSFRSLAVGAVGGDAVGMITEGQQRRNVAVGLEPHRTAVATVATVGPTERHVGLPSKRDTTGAAVASTEAQSCIRQRSWTQNAILRR